MRANSPLFLMDIPKLQVTQMLTFIELKREVEKEEHINPTDIKNLVRDMISIGIELEEAMASDKVRILIDPLEHYKI